MPSDSPPLAHITFVGTIIEWRGPAPFFFIAVPTDLVAAVRHAARLASYGWGVVPVQAVVNGTAFTTSLFPKDGGYLLPLKVAVRKTAGVALGDAVTVDIQVAATGGFQDWHRGR
ncbi:DUF1905 domain-containing protein [Niveispirillum sp. KHB5.9]|uniref:DUF1905 domain-containing protein n=1 Tax=Niveispirillum sp. KHB5.9 TaxID=3400269 RepID=UPI003A8B587C